LRRMAEQAPEGSDVPEIRMWRRFEPGIPPDARPTEIAVEDPWYEGQGAFDRTILRMRLSVPGIIEHAREMLAQRCPPVPGTDCGAGGGVWRRAGRVSCCGRLRLTWLWRGRRL